MVFALLPLDDLKEVLALIGYLADDGGGVSIKLLIR